MRLTEFTTVFWPDRKPEYSESSSITAQYFRHVLVDKRIHIFPGYSSVQDLNLDSIEELITALNIRDLLIVDRIWGAGEPICVADHVNRSGINFLRGKTPRGGRPMFPDMSKIYTTIDGLKPITVHTIGPEADPKSILSDRPLSKWAGIWTPAFSYLGVRTGVVNHRAMELK